MNTRTGEIHTLLDGEDLAGLAHRLGAELKDLVPVARTAASATADYGPCRKCNGTGAIRRGLQSKRFKPCSCVL